MRGIQVLSTLIPGATQMISAGGWTVTSPMTGMSTVTSGSTGATASWHCRYQWQIDQFENGEAAWQIAPMRSRPPGPSRLMTEQANTYAPWGLMPRWAGT